MSMSMSDFDGPATSKDDAEVMQRRPGFTLVELMITITIIGLLLAIGASSLRHDETDDTRETTMDIVDLFRRARYVAARENRAVVVTTLPYGTVVGSGQTRGYVDARLAPQNTCPAEALVAGLGIIETIDMGTVGDAQEGEATGLAWVLPNSLVTERFCVRPNGRIVSNGTGAPIRPAGTVTADDFAGKAILWVQYDPLRVDAGILAVPRMEIEVPFNGLVRIPQ